MELGPVTRYTLGRKTVSMIMKIDFDSFAFDVGYA